MRNYRFYKEWDSLSGNSNWFIDLKYFPFNKQWLAMVEGADKLLDKLANGEDEVRLLIDVSPIHYSDGVLERDFTIGIFKGAIYNAKITEIEHGFDIVGKTSQLWLCPATLWVFLGYPKKIYYKVDHTEAEVPEALPTEAQRIEFGNLGFA